MIYFIECGECVKIGKSDNTQSRLEALQVGNPYPMTLLKEVDVSDKAETVLHKKFAHLRTRGEWFLFDTELMEFIENADEELVGFGGNPTRTTREVPLAKSGRGIIWCRVDNPLEVYGFNKEISSANGANIDKLLEYVIDAKGKDHAIFLDSKLVHCPHKEIF